MFSLEPLKSQDSSQIHFWMQLQVAKCNILGITTRKQEEKCEVVHGLYKVEATIKFWQVPGGNIHEYSGKVWDPTRRLVMHMIIQW
jgi:hypothetical protein